MRRVGCAPGEPRGYDEDAESRSNAAAAVSRERIVGRAHELLRRWNLLPSMEERQVDGDRRPVAGAVMARHKDSRKQLSLFEADQADLPFDAYLPPEPRPLAQPGEQLPLFEGKTPLVGEVTAGVLKADFRAAREAYERLRESYPMDKSVSSFEFLSSVPDDFWSETRSDEERLSVWQAVAQCFQTNSTGYLKARDGFPLRLCKARRAARGGRRGFRLGDPVLQHRDQHGTTDAAYAAVLRTIRTRGHGRADPR